MSRRYQIGRVLAGALVLTTLVTSTSLARANALHRAAHDDTYDSMYYDPGYSSDYGDVTVGSGSDFYYDPGSSCEASICDSAFYDPSTNFYYDPTNQTSI